MVQDIPVGFDAQLVLLLVRSHEHRIEPHFRSGPSKALSVVRLPTRSVRRAVLMAANIDLYCEQEGGRCLVQVNHIPWFDYDTRQRLLVHGGYIKVEVPPSERFHCPTAEVVRLTQQGMTYQEILDVVHNDDAISGHSPSLLSEQELRELATALPSSDSDSGPDHNALMQATPADAKNAFAHGHPVKVRRPMPCRSKSCCDVEGSLHTDVSEIWLNSDNSGTGSCGHSLSIIQELLELLELHKMRMP